MGNTIAAILEQDHCNALRSQGGMLVTNDGTSQIHINDIGATSLTLQRIPDDYLTVFLRAWFSFYLPKQNNLSRDSEETIVHTAQFLSQHIHARLCMAWPRGNNDILVNDVAQVTMRLLMVDELATDRRGRLGLVIPLHGSFAIQNACEAKCAQLNRYYPGNGELGEELNQEVRHELRLREASVPFVREVRDDGRAFLIFCDIRVHGHNYPEISPNQLFAAMPPRYRCRCEAAQRACNDCLIKAVIASTLVHLRLRMAKQRIDEGDLYHIWDTELMHLSCTLINRHGWDHWKTDYCNLEMPELISMEIDYICESKVRAGDPETFFDVMELPDRDEEDSNEDSGEDSRDEWLWDRSDTDSFFSEDSDDSYHTE